MFVKTLKRPKAAIMINIEQIKEKLSTLSIDELAKDTGFEKRAPKKITAILFVLAFFKMLQGDRFTLKFWAALIADMLDGDQTVSKQSIAKRLQFGRESFAKALLLEAVTQSDKSIPVHSDTDLFSFCGKAILEDSMCLSLPDNVAEVIPGPHSTNGIAKSTARVQLSVNVITETYEKLEVHSYRNNDQSYAYESIRDVVQKGDLLIRDLGYHALGAFEEMNKEGIFFLSRYKSNVQIRLEKDADPIDLLKYLKTQRKRGVQVIDLDVFLGKEQVAVRLLIMELPENIAQIKRAKAKKHRGSTTNHSADYYELLGWNMYITNVKRETWSPEQIVKAYRCRWRIEIIFRCWKNRFNFDKFFCNKHSLNPAAVLITIYLMLTWLSLFFVRAFAFYSIKIYEQKRTWISLEQFADYAKNRCE